MIQDIVYKICYYAGDDHRNFSKLKQYLLLFRKANLDVRGKPLGNEVALRKHGGIKMLMKFLSCVTCSSEGTWTTGFGQAESALTNLHFISPQDTLRQVISIILNLLGNCFVTDVGAVKEAEKRDFADTLTRILTVRIGGTENLSEEKNILSRCLRCIANLANCSNGLKEKIIERGCGPQVMIALDDVNTVLERVLAESQERKAGDVIIEKNEESIVVEGARVLRILCCSNAQTQQDLVTQDGILRIGRFLKYSYNQTVHSEVLKALALLTNTSKRFPAQTINSLSCIEDKEGNILYRVVEAAKTCSAVAKVFNPALICLVQLSKYPNLQNTLINVGVFDVTLKLIGMFDDVGSLEKLVTILVQLTQPGANSYRLERTRVDQDFTLPNVVLSCCRDLGETLKVLRRKELSRFHLWILHLYSSLYGSKLKDIEAKGLLTVLFKRLEEEVGSLSMDRLNALLLTVENNACPVHVAAGRQCPFMPKYSCKSPSYQEVTSQTPQPDPATIVNMLNSTFVSSCNLSPPASPATHKDFSDELFSPSSSPQHVFGGSSSGYSSGAISSDDETMDDDSEDAETSSVRKRKFSTSGDEDDEAAETKRLKETYVSMDTDTAETKGQEAENDVKEKSKKIVYILGIVLQCSHLDRLPKEVLNFLPYVLEMVWRGRMSVEKGPNCQSLQQPTEDTLPLSRLCFQRSFKILLKICTDIHSFPYLVDHGVVQMIFRIFVYNLTATTKETETKIRDFRIEYSNKIMESLVGLCGDDNTIGYRQGELRKKCTEALSFPSTHSTGVLAIPLLYSNNSPLFMEFERLTSGWDSVLHILKHVDDLPSKTFNGCILALSSIAKAKGAKWIEPKLAEDRKLMYTEDAAFINSQLSEDIEDYVEFEMSDSSFVKLPKKFFTDASPVFAAMFGGTFREGREQKVQLNHVKSRTLRLLVGQMLMDNTQPEVENASSIKLAFDPEERDIVSLLELVELADQYLLFNLKERVLNTLILGYFCPHSASVIFEYSLNMNSGNTKKDVQTGTSFVPSRSNLNTDLTYLVLKYLLVGEHIGYSLRMTTFRNVFHIGPTEVILQNIAKLLRGE